MSNDIPSDVSRGRGTYDREHRPQERPTPTAEQVAASGVLRGREIYREER